MKPNLNKSGNTHKGYYKPVFPEKYVGDPRNILYRSSWEHTFMLRYCDLNANVKKWSSEPFYIPYYLEMDQKMHKYYVDFWVEMANGNKMLIEIKPNKNLKPPVLNENTKSEKKIQNYIYDLKMYYKNSAKWKAAIEFCKQRGWEFKIFTEKELNLKV